MYPSASTATPRTSILPQQQAQQQYQQLQQHQQQPQQPIDLNLDIDSYLDDEEEEEEDDSDLDDIDIGDMGDMNAWNASTTGYSSSVHRIGGTTVENFAVGGVTEAAIDSEVTESDDEDEGNTIQ